MTNRGGLRGYWPAADDQRTRPDTARSPRLWHHPCPRPDNQVDRAQPNREYWQQLTPGLLHDPTHTAPLGGGGLAGGWSSHQGRRRSSRPLLYRDHRRRVRAYLRRHTRPASDRQIFLDGYFEDVVAAFVGFGMRGSIHYCTADRTGGTRFCDGSPPDHRLFRARTSGSRRVSAGGSLANYRSHRHYLSRCRVRRRPHWRTSPTSSIWCRSRTTLTTSSNAKSFLQPEQALRAVDPEAVQGAGLRQRMAGRAWHAGRTGPDAGVLDLLAMIVSKRRSSSWHLIRMPLLGCVLVVAWCSAHVASETAPALLVRSASLRTGGCWSDLRRQRGCHQCGRPQRQIRHQGRRPTKALI